MTVIDPVCGMEMEEEEAGAVVEHGGETYYFCSDECRDEFAENADEYAGFEDDVEGLEEEEDEDW
jgi:P-type Cu+ transporter